MTMPVPPALPPENEHIVTVEFVFSEVNEGLEPDEPGYAELKEIRRASVAEALTESKLNNIGETFMQSDRYQELLSQIGNVIADGDVLEP